jgi:ferredoxin--NADP+ reductase
VARVLAKDSGELAGSDLSPEAMAWLEAQPIETIHVVGRRGAADAKFTQHELAELGTLQRAAAIVVDPPGLSGDGAIVETLRSFVASPSRDVSATIDFHFHLTPTAFLGESSLRAVQFRAADGTLRDIPAQLSVTCIGYETRPCCTASPTNGIFRNEGGKIQDRLYVVGWAKRGPSGTIPTNRSEAQQLAQRIAQEALDGGRPGRAGARQLLEQRQVCWVDHAAWRRIDAAELARASGERCRHKFITAAEMLEAAQSGELRRT